MIERDASDVYNHYAHALVCLANRDAAGYRERCLAVLKEFAEVQEPMAANLSAWSCILAPEAVEDFTTALTLAHRASESDHEDSQYLNTHGAVLYRAGRFQEALTKLTLLADRLEQPDEQSNSSPAYCWYFLAMTHQALDQADEAGRWLQKANAWSDKVHSDSQDAALWNRRLTLELLRNEASALIQTNPPAKEPAADPDPRPPAPPLPKPAEDIPARSGSENPSR